MIELVGQLAEVAGNINVKASRMKLQDVRPIEVGAIPTGDQKTKTAAERTIIHIGDECASHFYLNYAPRLPVPVLPKELWKSHFSRRLHHRMDENLNTIVGPPSQLPLPQMRN
jgi:hypothetical protein